MKNNNKNITIYCSSSNEIDDIYFSQTEELIFELAKKGYKIVYGGGDRGLMGTVANTALKQNAKITGIIPHFMTEREWEHKGISDMIHVDTMHQRKELLIKDTSAVIALPGGVGTLEELCEIIASKKLGLFTKPIIIYNINRFYDALFELIKKMNSERFTDMQLEDLINIAVSPQEVINIIENEK
ncbi:MAG: TIGR00730 family Rossman fold protein [Marinilabiliaceae bacterium]|nr:TIGR00730 family Rossman fold protein [Marinilabiliaceae bacterium]